MGRLLLPRLLGVAFVQLNFWINIRLASYMLPGSVNGLLYAFSLLLTPIAIIAQAIAIAALPTFSRQVAQGRLDEMRNSLAASLRGVILLALPAGIGLILLRQPVVELVFQRGAFDNASTELVAWALLWYSVGLVGHCMVEVLTRAYFAMHDTWTPVLIGVGAMSLNVLFSLAFVRLFAQVGWMPVGGLALANSLATLLEMGGLVVIMRRRLHGLQGRSILLGLGQAAAASLLMAAALIGWLNVSADQPVWLVVGLGILLGISVYALTCLVLRVGEARAGLRAGLRRLKALG